MTETKLSAQIREELETIGLWVERLQSGRTKVRGGYANLCSPGTPDLLVLSPITGFLGFLEIKRPGKALNANQIKWHRRAKAAGLRVHTCASVHEALTVALEWRAAP